MTNGHAEISIGDRRVALRVANVNEIIPLRHAELRAGFPLSTACFEGDHADTARHFGAFDARTGETLGCASFVASPWQGWPAHQLRGMATRCDFTKRGIGAALLKFAERTLRDESRVTLVWCNARSGAVPFYEKQGWEIASEEFVIPTVGPHHRMMKRLVNGEASV